jgi:hypothetical protein
MGKASNFFTANITKASKLLKLAFLTPPFLGGFSAEV